MSKIETVRKSFDKVKDHLIDHNLSFIFFNASSWSFSTLNNNMTHDDIFHQLQNVNCSGTTDFSTLIPFIDNIGENDISIIISDGYHTTCDNDNKLPYIKKLLHKFNYGIGIGSDFDHDLLSTISERCIFNNNTKGNIFDFLFLQDSPKTAVIPSNTFFVCDTDYIIKDNNNLKLDTNLLENTVYKQHIYCEEYTIKENFKTNKTHYFFC